MNKSIAVLEFFVAVGPAEACGEVRRLMTMQWGAPRLAWGFRDASVFAKNGDLPGIQNEVGVVQFGDGTRYALAFYTRSDALASQDPKIDRAIGLAARVAVDSLRSG